MRVIRLRDCWERKEEQERRQGRGAHGGSNGKGFPTLQLRMDEGTRKPRTERARSSIHIALARALPTYLYTDGRAH